MSKRMLIILIALLLILISFGIFSILFHLNRTKSLKERIDKLETENQRLQNRRQGNITDKKTDLNLIPWIELLKCGNPNEDFFYKYSITKIEVLDYIWLKCNENGSQGELFWRVFHFIGDLVEAGDAADYRRFCWIQCKKKPLLFYERYCKGDKLSFNRYYDACEYDPWGSPEEEVMTEKDAIKIMQNICVLIRSAKKLQIDDNQRNKDATMLEEYLKKYLSTNERENEQE